MGYREIVYAQEGHVGVVTLNRPEARNALTHTTYAELLFTGRIVDAEEARGYLPASGSTTACANASIASGACAEITT